jgi:flavin-dependent dehydrogenase
VTVLRAGRRTGVTLVTWDRSSPAEAQLTEFLAAAQQAKLVSDNLVAQPTGAVMPAGIALDMETLVAKRCLLIGEAAGFVTAFSNELIYPTMKSGWVAAEAAARALRAPVLQDELLSFSPAWRAELADYLRLPNTDLALLMPLVFNNPQMSGRVARAFLLGQSF